jgi:hypothetical protein
MQIEKESTGELLRVSTSDGKYTVIQHESGGVVSLRYGEPWMHVTGNPGDNLILALAQDLDDARKQAVEHEKDADAWTRVSMQIQHQKNKFARALRWVFKNGMHPDHSRPQHVNEAFNEAWEGHRANDPWAARLGEPET